MAELNEPAIPLKPRTSKLAVAAFILGILSIPTLSLTALPAVICAFLSLIKIARSSKRLKGVGWALAGMVIPVLFVIPATVYLLIGFFQDAPPIPNDYTVADLHNADPQYNASYELIRSSFTDESDDPNGAPAIGLSREDIDFIKKLTGLDSSGRDQIRNNIKRINELWEKAARGREVIKRLSEYPEIADMDELILTSNICGLVDLKYLVRLYYYYAVAQLLDGKPKDGLRELCCMNQISQKMSVTSRWMVRKLTCYGILQINIDAATQYINDPNVSRDDIILIANSFTPLADKCLSLRNAMISEHIWFREEVKKLPLIRMVIFKPNSSIRYFRNYEDYWISRELGEASEVHYLDVWPEMLWFMPPLKPDFDEAYPWYYDLYNPFGKPLILPVIPYNATPFKIKNNIRIKDDLFQYILARRLGKEGDLTARAFGQKYIVDIEKKRIYSPGPDGQPFTKDDIWLPIEPNVLGLIPKGQ
jgi:hypothetical protein